nr:ribosomal protein L34Ae protein [Tanacetum cinerariifolium]
MLMNTQVLIVVKGIHVSDEWQRGRWKYHHRGDGFRFITHRVSKLKDTIRGYSIRGSILSGISLQRDGTKRFREVLRHSWILSMRKREYPVMPLEPEEEYKELEVVLKRMGPVNGRILVFRPARGYPNRRFEVWGAERICRNMKK